MARRGSYSKGVAKREEILEAALAIVARVGYGRTTVRELADAVGLSQTGLLHYFGSKEDLFTAILARRDATDRLAFAPPADPTPDIPGSLMQVLRHNADVPGLVELYTRFAGEAARPEHRAHTYFRDRYHDIRRLAAEGVAELQRDGRLPAHLDPQRFAVLTVALMDGLQMQWLYDPEIDMADHVAYLWELLSAPAPPSTG
ncbi:TetR/AcrR family transcriptional regulator [Nocardia flavorosea]|uniref:TetR/AcrR family transcriptional regulator n=1 Tax=Nocardia flavorosea TaxID=53429 RepID=A0A846YMU1_9NOCA|nr:TetR/AcrR family transcriptional regulator [Nocardia flavorosea]NKY59051.1 TetR/AcrR family transcriptional regulator [Nocardia flavorosea]